MLTEGLLRRGVVTGGMAVKVRQALESARSGVEVRIGDEAILSRPDAGTRMRAGRVPLAVGSAP